ncbi:MAG: bifunctional aldolase/short-chain dehydrogenase [Pseudomonadota bacterium]
MENLWSDSDARRFADAHAAQGLPEELGLRVYTTQLLGGEPRLVLHGGGNTSVKLKTRDVAGDAVDVLHVKGSGWDMATIEAPGLPAVRLAPLQKLRALGALSDEDMVNAQRSNLLDSKAPNPSVETLLHAFLPHRFIDHTHAVAVLSLIDQPNADALIEEVYGARLGVVPYVIPGFALAKSAANVFERGPDVEGLILAKHGIFTFGDTAREAYERMIEFVSLAEARIAKGAARPASFAAPAAAATISKDARGTAVATAAPLLRRALQKADPKGRPWIVIHRGHDAAMEFAAGADRARYATAGVATPDHVIRTKAEPVLLKPASGEAWRDAAALASHLGEAVGAFAARYDAYFERHNARWEGAKTQLDPCPRIFLTPGLGLFAVGKSYKDAAIAADVYEASMATIRGAERIGQFESISEADIFDMEYWSLEQAKLGKAAEKPLARRIVAVTGAAGAIGRATARAFAAQGAEVALLDRDADGAAAAAAEIGGSALPVVCDVTDEASVNAAFEAIIRQFGGVDIAVSNAGAAWKGPIGELSMADLRASFELNFFAHQHVAKAATAIFRAQGFGGCLLFNASKQAVNPGPDFGAYGLPKAATLFLSRQYALEYGADGVRSNAVNADRIRSGLLTDEMIKTRSAARGLSEDAYLSANLLREEVTADDVAKAFVDLALSPKTTGGVFTVDGGNIAAAMR